MRISSITNWAYGVTVVLTALSGSAFILSARSASLERDAVEQFQKLDDLGDELAIGAEERTDQARLFVMRGEQRHLDALRGDEGQERRREVAIENIRKLDLEELEDRSIDEVTENVDDLDKLETDAVAAFQAGDKDGARQALFGPEHERIQSIVLTAVDRFRDLTAVRTKDAVARAKASSDLWSTMAKVMLAITAAVFLGVLYFVLRRRVSVPLVRMTKIVGQLAKQDYAVELPTDKRSDEIGDMNEAIQIFRDNGLERERLDAERRRDQMTKDLILQMMHRLQACQTQGELADVVALFAPLIFPDLPGHLFVMNESRSALSCTSSWLEPSQSQMSFASIACWGLRRGRPHISNRDHSDIPCQHLDAADSPTLCVPLTAQGDAVGLIYFEQPAEGESTGEISSLYLEMIAENIGLAIANLQLREKLTNLATRDALTGLFNRRSLDEALNRHGRLETDETVICLMIDIDHFKHFNDDHGHDAGDEVMRYVAELIRDIVGGQGAAYRYGGEEFTVLLPGLAPDEGYVIAEQIRTTVGNAPLSHRGRILGSVSLSIGLATSAGQPISSLLGRADSALLQAKADGRDRTVRETDKALPLQAGVQERRSKNAY